ncbi:MAG: hypothetical protein IJY17_05390 [Alphaproteobacteria bacterium]|nr:hypothetical protein [Alphaproteobacteria bacterium]
MSYLQKKRKARNRLIAAVAASVIVLAAYKCLGETAPSPVVEEKFSVSVKEDTTLEPDAPTAASFVGLEDDRRFQAYDMTQIELTGKITGPDKEAYTVEWTELHHIGNDRSAGLTVPMTTTEKPEEDSVIKDGTVLPVSAGKDQLTSVLPMLFLTPAESKKKEDDASTAGDISAPVIAVPVGSNSGEKSSDEKNGFDSSAIEVAEQPQDEIAFRLDECPIRIDWDNDQVYFQKEVVKTVNGTDVERQGCQDADFPVNILRSYAECSDDVVMQDLTAYKMYKPYFIDQGEQKFLKDCTRDTEKSYQIKESIECTPLVDTQNNTVKELSYLYYTDDTERDVTVSECQIRDTTRTFDLQFTYDTCSYRLDSNAGMAYQQGKYFFEKDGQSVDVSTCQDSDLTYRVENEFCSYQENMASKKMLRYERQKLNTINGVVYITECQPVGQTDIIETVDGCETLHTDDFKGGFSKGWSRYYYIDKDEQQHFITKCAVSTTTYAHQAVVEDWQVDFNSLTATSLIAYYIDLPKGRVKIADAAITKDSITVPLAKQSEEIVGSGELSYNGCYENERQQIKTGYLLPNGNMVYNYVYIAEPKTRYVCRDETQDAAVGIYTGWYKQRPGKLKSHVTYYVVGANTYRRTKSYNTVTGQYVCSAWQFIGQSLGTSKSSCPSAACYGPVCQGAQYDAGSGVCVSNMIQPNLPCG